MQKRIEDVKRGDIILEGRKEILVKKVEPRTCSSLDTHINGSMCYPRGSMVRTKDVVNPEATGMGDLEEDNLLSSLLGGLADYIETGSMPPPDRNGTFSDRALFRKLAAQPNS